MFHIKSDAIHRSVPLPCLPPSTPLSSIVLRSAFFFARALHLHAPQLSPAIVLPIVFIGLFRWKELSEFWMEQFSSSVSFDPLPRSPLSLLSLPPSLFPCPCPSLALFLTSSSLGAVGGVQSQTNTVDRHTLLSFSPFQQLRYSSLSSMPLPLSSFLSHFFPSFLPPSPLRHCHPSTSSFFLQQIVFCRQMKRYGVPSIAFINKLDRAGSNPWSVIKQVVEEEG